MEQKVNYTRVGLFVLLFGAALVGVLLWLGKREYRKEYRHYYVYVQESVTGLSVDASVKYHGVDVGYLREMVVDPNRPEQVRLTLSVAPETPVKIDTEAVLEFQGLTGVALINLTNGSRESPPLTARPGERYPVIQNTPSLYALLSRALTDPSLPRLIHHLDDLTVNTQTLVNDENRAAVRQLLTETAKITQTVDRMTERVGEQLPILLTRLQESSQALQEMSNRAVQTSAMVERLIDHNRASLDVFTGQTLTESGLLVSELRQLTATTKRLASKLEREPNALIFGKGPLPRGPGE
ncbi:MAG: MCE family protein [Nitrospirae bacterium]|nr:MCE family protein [Candidatus Manganitrophaceae bacterium]